MLKRLKKNAHSSRKRINERSANNTHHKDAVNLLYSISLVMSNKHRRNFL